MWCMYFQDKKSKEQRQKTKDKYSKPFQLLQITNPNAESFSKLLLD